MKWVYCFQSNDSNRFCLMILEIKQEISKIQKKNDFLFICHNEFICFEENLNKILRKFYRIVKTN